jgi:hypothetical protein
MEVPNPATQGLPFTPALCGLVGGRLFALDVDKGNSGLWWVGLCSELCWVGLCSERCRPGATPPTWFSPALACAGIVSLSINFVLALGFGLGGGQPL